MADIKDVFISYDMRRDNTVVERICKELEETYHISCWYASRDHVIGQFRESINGALDNSWILLLVLTKQTRISNNIEYELETAFRNIKKSERITGDIKIVCLDDREPDDKIRLVSGFRCIYAGPSTLKVEK